MEYKHNNRNDFWPRESLNSRRADAIHHISAVINCSVIRVTFNIIFSSNKSARIETEIETYY